MKIFSVRVFGSANTQTEDAVLEGFQFLLDVAQETNLKVVN